MSIGRAAVALGFDNAPEAVKKTLDVDVVISASQAEELQRDSSFWGAQEATNAELKAQGFYLTHIFLAEQIFLRRHWEQQIVPITSTQLRWLRVFRPATLDLILTKMMRGDDAQDMEDIAFMIRHDRIAPEQIEDALAAAVIPDLIEFHEAFEKAKPRVREMARAISRDTGV